MSIDPETFTPTTRQIAHADQQVAAAKTALAALVAEARTITGHGLDRWVATALCAADAVGEQARSVDDITGAAINLLTAAVIRITELDPAAPRVWAMPPEPGPEVTRVRDVYGQCFERAVDVDLEHGSVPVWLGNTFSDEADVPDLALSWKQLIAEHAPLTEVDGSQT